MEDGGKIQTFTQLNAWKEAHTLVVLIYQMTKLFPKEELFGLVNQMRRAAISITSNIAEGFGRQTWKEKTQFYSIALGSLRELHSQLLVARDVEYISTQRYQEIEQHIDTTSRLLRGLIKKSQSMI